MKIAISGTHGVGKTTLAAALAEELKVPLIREAARDLIEAYGYKRSADMPLEMAGIFQEGCLGYKIVRQRECENGYVADRGCFECLPYYLARVSSPIHPAMLSSLTRYKDLALSNSDYDYILYLPIEFGMDEQDVLRSPEDTDFQKRIDRDIRYVISRYLSHIPCVELSGVLEERLAQALAVLL